MFGVHRSGYYAAMARRDHVDEQREHLHEVVKKLHEESRGSAGARSISAGLRAEGHVVGRYKASRLMVETGLSSNQPRKHQYKVANEASKIAPNLLERAFEVERPNQVWCGDVTYIWAGTQWLYLAVVIDLFAR